MIYEARRHIVECYFGKFWHYEKIVQSLMKKYDLVMTEEEVEKYVESVDEFLRSKPSF